MNAQQLKFKLRDARDAVNSNDTKTAIQLCREILATDKDHYMAHLLIAKAYQDNDQNTAAMFLRKAVALTNDPLIPYQGLTKCVKQSELPEILYELLKLQPDKYEEYYGKLIECGKKLTDPDPCLEVMQSILDSLETTEEDEVKRKLIFYNLSDLFLKLKEVPDKWKKLYAESLRLSIKRSHVDQHENYRKCIKYFSELKCNVELLTVCCDMFESFKNDSYPLEWICKIYTENMKTKEIPKIKEVLKKDIREYIEALYMLNPKSILGLITKGIHHFNSGEFFEALDIFTAVNEIKPNWATCLRMLVQVYQQFRAFDLAEQYHRDMKSTDVNFIKCLLNSRDAKKLQEAEQLIRDVMESGTEEDTGELLHLEMKNKLLLGKGDIEECLKELKVVDEAWWARTSILQKSLQGNNQEALELFSSIFELSSDDLVKRGELQYSLGKANESTFSFMNALKKDLSNSIAFHWLGRLYFEDGDYTRSRKCVEKCLRMNPLNEDALKILKILTTESKDDQVYHEILEEAAKHGSQLNIHWPVKMFGDFYREQGDFNEAAIHYRNALRITSQDYDCWIALGNIQLENNTFVPALRIFEKIAQLFPEKANYAKLQIAVIKTKMDNFQEAELEFNALIDRDPTSLEVFKEYARAHLSEAEFKKNKRLFGRSKDHVQKATDLLCSAHKINSDDMEVNLLIAKALNFAGNFPTKLSSLEMPRFMLKDDHVLQEIVAVKNENLFVLANKFFELIATAAAGSSSNDQLYFLMAENSFQRYNLWANAEETDLEVLHSAISYIKLAIGLNANRWEYWNLYGLLLSTDEIGEPEVAEEVFNVALQINKSSFIIWANLGTLYLKCNEVSAANRAFGKAQQYEIGYENGWLGQAMIADRLSAEDEAMDLYRHCLELDYHRLAAVGYSRWVTERMDCVHVKKYRFAIENMYAVPMCLDAIGWYMKEVDTKASVKSLCYLGYLAYHKGLYNVAAEAYLKASVKAEGEDFDDILFNLGYIYLVLERPEQAVKVFKNIQRISMEAQVGLAVAHFKAKNYEVTYSIYQSALESLAQTDEERIEILTAMAALVYEFQGEDDAKTILMQCVILSNPVKGLLNICALCLLHDDLQTAGLVVKELKAFENNLDYCADVAFLISNFLLKMNDSRGATNYILSMIHKFPNNAKLRTLYVNLILKGKSRDEKSSRVSGKMAESALALTRAELLRSNSNELSRALALISVAKDGVDARQQRIFAQKAMFVNPESKAARKALEMCSC